MAVPVHEQVGARGAAAVRRIVAAGPHSLGLHRITRLAARLLEADSAQVLLTGDSPLVVSSAGSDEGADSSGSELQAPLEDHAGTRLGTLSVRSREARHWTAAQLEILSELAGGVVAELELRAVTAELGASAARLDLALQAADIGSFDLDIQSARLDWDNRLIELFGYDPEHFVPHLDSFLARLHPDDRPRVTAVLEQTIATGSDVALDYRIVRTDGETRWVTARGRITRDRSGRAVRLLGTAHDSTVVRDRGDRLARLLETMTDAFFSLDRCWLFTYVNDQAERLLGRSRDELLGRDVWAEFPLAVGTEFEEQYRRAVATGERVTFEAYYPAPLDTWFEVTASPDPDGLSVYLHDVTVRRRAEADRLAALAERELVVEERERALAEAAAANGRLEVIAEASTRLSASLEPDAVLSTLADLLVPSAGEWATVALRADVAAALLDQEAAGDPDRIRVVHAEHRDPARTAALLDVTHALALSTADRVGIGHVIATGRPEWLPQVPARSAPGRPASAHHPGSSALTVPMTSRDRVLGALTIGDPASSQLDQSLISDLARRAAVALDNAILYRTERRIGLTLQRSLLPRDVPQLPGVEVAVRYLPGTSGAFVGGDFYSGMQVGDQLLLALGDVMGHGMRSAARMGQLRAIVATLALEGHGPAELLRRLAANTDALLDLELATLLVCLYDPAAGTVTAATAGHPPPLVSPARDAAAYLDLDPGPPLGAGAGRFPEVTVALPPASTLVLFSDGLVESRREPLGAGLERLRVALAEVQMPPELVCDHLLRAMDRTDGADDDVALLVMRSRTDGKRIPHTA